MKIFTAFALLLLASTALAQEIKVEVIVPAQFEPQTAVGILITKDGTFEYPIGDVRQSARRLDEKHLVVAFPIEGPVYADTYASALVLSADGKSAYGEVRRVSDKSEGNLIKALTICPVKSITDPVVMSKSSELQQLVSVRIEKRKLIRNLLKDALTDEALTKIRGMETLFGLKYEREFSADLPAVELVTRLRKIEISLGNLDYYSQFLAQPSPAAPAAAPASAASPEAGSGEKR